LSDDEGSKNNRGELEYSSMYMANLAKEFSDYIFYKPAGSKDVIKTSFGYHVIEVLSQKNFEESYKMAYLSKKILASPETDNSAASGATQFAGNSRNLKSFDENVNKMNLTKRVADNIREMDYSVSGLPSRAIVKWIYENKVGSVSEPFDLKDKYVVLAITGALEEGVQPASVARMMVEPLLRNRKKASEIRKKLGDVKSLESAATAMKVSVLQSDSVIFSNPFIPDLGNEPKVIGASFNKNLLNKVSEPIEGTNGVFLIKANRQSAQPSANADVNLQKKAQEAQLRQYSSFSTLESLRKSAKIEDGRRSAGY
jgi:peptidyl-prolyl cis-trans isomerase D